MARALIVGCGCRGRALGARLAAQGWAVRGTSRREDGCKVIEASGIEAAIADPSRPGTLLDLVGDVTAVVWLLGDAEGEAPTLDAIHGDRLQALVERLVDTPVRGLVYEGAGRVGEDRLRAGAQILRTAAETWRIPVELVDADPEDHERWLAEMTAACGRLLG